MIMVSNADTKRTSQDLPSGMYSVPIVKRGEVMCAKDPHDYTEQEPKVLSRLGGRDACQLALMESRCLSLNIQEDRVSLRSMYRTLTSSFQYSRGLEAS